MKEIYLDYAATTPVDKKVFETMIPFFTHEFGNPSSIYQLGLNAKKAVKDARLSIATSINANLNEIFFTGSGTESDNLAITGIARANKKNGNHIITSKIEHPAVLETVKKLEKEGFAVTYLSVDRDGIVDIEELKNSIRENTILISIMYANNEIGTVEPIAQIGNLIKEMNKEKVKKGSNSIYFHTDACQAAGFFKLNVEKLNIDAMTINGSKIYGPKGSGFLYVKKGVPIEPIINGGGQENGLRSGTENVANIVGIAKAFELAQENYKSYYHKLSVLQKYFIEKLTNSIPRIFFNGSLDHKLPHIISVTILDIEGESMLLALDQKGIYCSTGSACSMHSLKPSHVLKAIGLVDEAIHGTLRFSLGEHSTKKDIDYTVKELAKVTETLRKISPIHININDARILTS